MSWACPAVRAVPGDSSTAMGADRSPGTRPDGTGIGRARAAEERARWQQRLAKGLRQVIGDKEQDSHLEVKLLTHELDGHLNYLSKPDCEKMVVGISRLKGDARCQME